MHELCEIHMYMHFIAVAIDTEETENTQQFHFFISMPHQGLDR
jgi:hypothetical protein